MEFKIDKQIVVNNELYGALGDDFSIRDRESIELLIDKVNMVLTGEKTDIDIYGSVCYKIHVTKIESLIYCYDELLGSEPSQDIYEMLKAWYSFLEEPENNEV
ncbi:hypothetical protein ABW636_11410 [Aquimarina sp. 2201CG1-2-11]|uniref:hypothetical protein n=1 Tax=Aquimarina discodermiae TaxID=3231043 RepID=UPI0034624F80